MMRHASALCLVFALSGCAADDEPAKQPTPYALELPEGFPSPVLSAENPLTLEKIELGRWLFYDERLSGNGEQACGTCHLQSKAFTDGLVVSEGSTGEHTPRNALALVNVAYNTTLTWANPTLKTLEAQFKVPMFGEFPIELGLTNHEEEVLERFRQDPAMVERFKAAFPELADPINFDRIIDAMACFVRTMISGDSPFDRYQYGLDDEALTDSEKRGLTLFFGEKAECYHCHGGFNLSGATTHASLAINESSFFNNGLYNVDGKGSYPSPNQGLWTFTEKPDDMGRFRVPTLRNIEVTAPYMHDGSFETLEDVVRFYEAGGRNIETGDEAGDGRANPYKSVFVSGFELTDQEREDLIAFLKSLTDKGFLTNPAFADPNPE